MVRTYVVSVTNKDGHLTAKTRDNDGPRIKHASRDYGRSLEDCAVELACDLVGECWAVGGEITGIVADYAPTKGIAVVVTFDNLSQYLPR